MIVSNAHVQAALDAYKRRGVYKVLIAISVKVATLI